MSFLESPESIVAESVLFRSGAYRLEGEFLYPESAAPTGAAVIANPHPMLGGDMRNNVVVGLGDGLAERGLAVLRFNYRGIGCSEGPRVDVASHLAWFWENSHIAEEIELHTDLEAAIGFLRTAVSPNLPIAAIGYSFGCALLPHVDSIDKLDSLVLVAPTVTKHDYDSYKTVTRPLLVIAPEDDFATDSATIRQWFDQITAPKQIVTTLRDNHFFRGHEAWLAQTIHTFLAARWR
jgi:alpha/beta superfamily hydrolase